MEKLRSFEQTPWQKKLSFWIGIAGSVCAVLMAYAIGDLETKKATIEKEVTEKFPVKFPWNNVKRFINAYGDNFRADLIYLEDMSGFYYYYDMKTGHFTAYEDQKK